MNGAGYADAAQQQGHETDEREESSDIPEGAAGLFLLSLDGGEFVAGFLDAVFDAFRQ